MFKDIVNKKKCRSFTRNQLAIYTVKGCSLLQTFKLDISLFIV